MFPSRESWNALFRGPSFLNLAIHRIHVSQRPPVMGGTKVAAGRELILWLMELSPSGCMDSTVVPLAVWGD